MCNYSASPTGGGFVKAFLFMHQSPSNVLEGGTQICFGSFISYSYNMWLKIYMASIFGKMTDPINWKLKRA